MKGKRIFAEIFLALSAIILLILGRVEPQVTPGMSTGNIRAVNSTNDPDEVLLYGQNDPGRIPPKSVASLFLDPSSRQISIPTTTPTLPTIAEKNADWIKVLGIIRDSSDIERLYLKDTLSGRIMKVRLDGTPESGVSLVTDKSGIKRIKIDNDIFKLTGELSQ